MDSGCVEETDHLTAAEVKREQAQLLVKRRKLKE